MPLPTFEDADHTVDVIAIDESQGDLSDLVRGRDGESPISQSKTSERVC
jgi:hypothetical protein